MRTYLGVTASRGLAVGPVFRLDRAAPTARIAGLPELETARLNAALDLAKQELDGLQAQAAPSDRDIFLFQRMLLEDKSLLEGMRGRIAEGSEAADAVEATGLQFAHRLRNVQDEYISQRSADVLDACQRVSAILDGNPRGTPILTEPSILVADSLYPSDIVGVDRNLLLGLATAAGSSQSHAAIIARTMGLPAVIQLGRDVLADCSGSMAALDADNGRLILNPDPQLLNQLEERHRCTVNLVSGDLLLRPCRTADGTRVYIMANCTAPDDIEAAMAMGAEGVGLLRSEYSLLSGTPPTEEQQYQYYKNCLLAAGGRPVTVRTFDIGEERAPVWLQVPMGPNPALGLRGLRFCLTQPELFRMQLRALLRAAAQASLSVVFPMVGGPEEWDAAMAQVELAKEELHERGEAFRENTPFGCMIEVPSAALTADALASHGCAFFSIGTNDLVQYTCAADRAEPEMQQYYRQENPAVSALVQAACDAAERAGIPVSVSGLTAANPYLACTHVRQGVRTLSMSSQSFAAVRSQLARLDLRVPAPGPAAPRLPARAEPALAGV